MYVSSGVMYQNMLCGGIVSVISPVLIIQYLINHYTSTHIHCWPTTKTVEGSLPQSLSVGVSEDSGIEHRREEVNWTGPEKRNIELALLSCLK